MTGKVCIVTGANSGIGKAASRALAKLGATVVMLCRDAGTGEAARSEIAAGAPSPIELMVADLASQQAIRRVAKELLDTHPRLDVLVNNAGVYRVKRSLTDEGIETTFAVNHLSYFLLTNLLLDRLRASAPARIVNVSSAAHHRGSINFADLGGERGYSGFRAYPQAKLANVLFTYELARKLAGTGVTANCLHPGAVRTKLWRDAGGALGFVFKIIRPFMIGPERGAETVVYLASSPEVEGVSGKYFVKKRIAESSKASYDEAMARRLWQVSEELTGLSPRVEDD
jgi:NAD(P)-dependent dehydrogenase (short-subunit alcohol dehydrogenase family)